MRRLVLAFFVTFLLAGCGSGGGDRPAVSESAAYDRVESYVRRAATALPDDARLEAATQPSSVACKGQPLGRVTVVTTYFVRDIAYADKHVDAMLRWWQAHDFEVLDDLRPERHYIWVQNKTDGFRMSLRDTQNGDLLLGAESPCLTGG
jgi:hypothetical protein